MVSFTIRIKTLYSYACALDVQTEIDPVATMDSITVHTVSGATSFHSDQKRPLFPIHRQPMNSQKTIIIIHTPDDLQDCSASSRIIIQFENYVVLTTLESTDDPAFRRKQYVRSWNGIMLITHIQGSIERVRECTH
jgi:hypothetical protein